MLSHHICPKRCATEFSFVHAKQIAIARIEHDSHRLSCRWYPETICRGLFCWQISCQAAHSYTWLLLPAAICENRKPRRPLCSQSRDIVHCTGKPLLVSRCLSLCIFSSDGMLIKSVNQRAHYGLALSQTIPVGRFHRSSSTQYHIISY